MSSGPSFSSAFIFSVISLILSNFPLTSFHLAEASISVFKWLYTLVCAVVQKYHEMFIFNYSHFQYTLCNQPVFRFFFFFLFLFAQLENVKKLLNNNRTVHVKEKITIKTKPSQVAFKLTTRSIVRFSPHKIQCFGEGMASLSYVRVKRKISCIIY